MTVTEKEPSYFLERKQLGSDRTRERLELQIKELEQRVDAALELQQSESVSTGLNKEVVDIWGVPFTPYTLAETLMYIDELIEAGNPGYFITANLNYNMLTAKHPELDEVNRKASCILCDGMPMVWWSRLRKLGPLPERVAGSELIYALTKWAATKEYRIFFLGGAPGIAQAASEKLSDRYPGFKVVGVESPPFRPLTDEEEEALIQRIRDAKADIIYLAFGQPRGEQWIAENCERLGIPVCLQLGASFDFVAGGVARAPRWMQGIGLEWLYRLCQEPGRLTKRYSSNAWFMVKAIIRDLTSKRQDGRKS